MTSQQVDSDGHARRLKINLGNILHCQRISNIAPRLGELLVSIKAY